MFGRLRTLSRIVVLCGVARAELLVCIAAVAILLLSTSGLAADTFEADLRCLALTIYHEAKHRKSASKVSAARPEVLSRSIATAAMQTRSRFAMFGSHDISRSQTSQ